MDIKIAVLAVFISVIYIANAKPMEEFGKFSKIFKIANFWSL